MKEHVGVVIPARNEEHLIERCLTSVRAAASAAGGRVTIVVVTDACTDATIEVAKRVAQQSSSGAEWVIEVVNVENVGQARALGSRIAIDRGCSWLAHTDADSVVPTNWIREQRAISRAGIDVMIGTVRPDFADLSPAHVEKWRATHIAGKPNGHVHGANLGLSVQRYLEIDGFAPMPEHEDVDLVHRLRQAGAIMIASDRAEVMTSGRLYGRTAGGYAGHLRGIARELELS